MSNDKMRDRQSELQILYLRNMQKIKWRINAILDIQHGRRTTTYQHTNIEFCVLQIRKILELIAFSSLVSDTDIYKERLNNIEKMWNAKHILADIERIHPDFYPTPIVIDEKNRVWNDLQEPYLTREKFVKVYDRCGKFLHEDSPYKTEKEIQGEYEQISVDIKNGFLSLSGYFPFILYVSTIKKICSISVWIQGIIHHTGIFLHK